MKLYHYTTHKNGKAIARAGLKAHEDKFGFKRLGAVVWFTAEPNPVWWCEDGGRSECRISVELADDDKRLTKFSKLLRQLCQPGSVKKAHPKLRKAAIKNWFAYFGNVPRSKIKRIGNAPRGKTVIPPLPPLPTFPPGFVLSKQVMWFGGDERARRLWLTQIAAMVWAHPTYADAKPRESQVKASNCTDYECPISSWRMSTDTSSRERRKQG